jgi:hypothetical protein
MEKIAVSLEVTDEILNQQIEMDFSLALFALRRGRKIARAGWNGKGMYLYLVGAGRYPPSTPAGRAIAAGQPDGLVPYRPYIAMLTVDREVVPWVASQSDLLCNDWVEVE